ncbi:MAG: hypothetical protein IJY04_02850 [Clostridia bacterium]|nr:hypothetical protein [Clostridia bacterium]
MKIRISVIMVVLLCLGASIPAVLLNAQTYSASVARKMYNPTLDTGFGLSDSVSGTVYGSSGYTSLKVYSDDGSISTGTYNGVNAYGISGVNAYLKFKINIKASVDEYLLGSPEWLLCYDSWGRIDGEKVNGVTTGEIGSGALIVQTSYDGKNWSSDNKAKYNNGLYTTDYYAHHGTKEVCIYTPAGSDVSRGIYIRVLYAYEVYDAIACTHENNWWDKLWGASKYKHDNHNDYENYVEA